MPYIITQACEGVCDTACVDVCPVDCIHGPIDTKGRGAEVKKMTEEAKKTNKYQLYINPSECIDCGACEPECPVNAIYESSEVPKDSKLYTQLNKAFFDKNQNEFKTLREKLTGQK